MAVPASRVMISIRNLQVHFGDVHAVDGLSLDIAEGALVGLLGPNGAGKTTTLNCVAGLLEPTGGQVQVGGVDVATDPVQVKRMLGVVPQSLALYSTLSVATNLRLFGGIFGVEGKRLNERVAWGLELSQLESRRDAVVGTLSGGMKRRLNLACALLHDPKIIICDEPTTGVDPQSRNHIFETIRRLHHEGRTVIYTTHYMEEVEALCERVAILDHGKLIAEDSLAGLLRGSKTSTSFRLELTEGKTKEDLGRILLGSGLELAGLDLESANLEQVFLNLTGRALRDGDELALPAAEPVK